MDFYDTDNKYAEYINRIKFNDNRINTFIFDMDGTTLDTLCDLTVSINFVLNKFDMPKRDVSEIRKFVGNGIREAFRLAVLDGTPASVLDEMLPIFKEHYDIHCLDNTRPYEGITDVLCSLREKGLKTAIVSNKIDSAVQELYEKFFSESVDIAIGEQEGINRKPAPDMVNLALQKLNSTREESIYIGDSEVDLLTANNSNLPCISVLWGFRDKEYLINQGAYCFAKEPRDILKL